MRLRQRWYGTPFDAVLARVPAGARVVDVGCGFGLLAAALAVEGRRVTGIDLDAGKIARGRALFGAIPGLDLEEGDLATAALPACDAVVICDVLHHLRDPVVERVLAAAFDRLRPGGVLVVKENDVGPAPKRVLAELVELVAVGGGITHSDPWRFRSVDEWGAAMRAAGFTVLEARPIGCHGYGRLLPHSLIVGEP
jgi:SAM-dependent methyltransferase